MCRLLNEKNISCTVILDSAVGYVMEQVDMVMVVERTKLTLYYVCVAYARFLEHEISVLQRYRSVNCCFSVART